MRKKLNKPDEIAQMLIYFFGCLESLGLIEEFDLGGQARPGGEIEISFKFPGKK